jgi:hypothetical protein
MISPEQVGLRIDRLNELSLELAKEIVVIADGNDPLLHLERRAYLNALRDAVAGFETARVILARARQRWRGSQEAGSGEESPG